MALDGVAIHVIDMTEAEFRQWCELALRQRTADSEMTIRLVDEAEGREENKKVTWLVWRARRMRARLYFVYCIPCTEY